jgi:hypothetical protein
VAILEALVGAFLAVLRPKASLVVENLVLRQQLAVLRSRTPRPRLRPIDRVFWVLPCCPETGPGMNLGAFAAAAAADAGTTGDYRAPL